MALELVNAVSQWSMQNLRHNMAVPHNECAIFPESSIKMIDPYFHDSQIRLPAAKGKDKDRNKDKVGPPKKGQDDD